MGLFQIGQYSIGVNCEPFIIAEAGINHNGDMEIAKKMVDTAKAADCDAIKFQTFYAKEFVTDRSTLYTYKSQGKEITEPIIDMFERTEFSKFQWRELKDYCDEVGIIFLSSPGNYTDSELLVSLGVQALKVGSDDFVNLPLIKKYAEFNIPLLLSCGMAKEEEIEDTLNVAGLNDGKELCLLLCTSQYPTPPEDVNVSRLRTLSKKYPSLCLGFSDHTKGITAAVMALSYGACVFEKHFTLDHNLPGPDHWFSEDYDGLKKWTEAIREAFIMKGKGDFGLGIR